MLSLCFNWESRAVSACTTFTSVMFLMLFVASINLSNAACKGVDIYQVCMLYTQNSRQTVKISNGGIISIEVHQLECEANG